MQTSTIEISNINREIADILQEEGFDLSDERTVRLAQRLSTQSQYVKENGQLNQIFDRIVEDLASGFALIINKKFAFGNKFFCTLTGYTEDELKSLSNSLSIIHPQDVRGIEIAFKRLYSGVQDKIDIVHRLVTKTGVTTWVRSQFIANKNSLGRVESVVVSTMDLSLLNETQQKSEELSIVYESLIDNSSEGLEILELSSADKDAEFKLITRNPAMRRILPQDDCYYTLPDHFKSIMPEYQSSGLSSQQALHESWGRIMKNRQDSGEFDFIIDGERRKINYEVQLLKVNDKFLFIRHFRDVSELKSKELELRINEKKLRGIIEALPGGITMIDKTGKHIFTSPQANKIFGHPANYDFTGTFVTDYFVKKNHKELIEFSNNNQKPESKYFNLQGIRSDRSEFPVEIHAKKFVNEETGESEIITYINDSTEKQIAQNDIKERKAIYEALIDYSFSGIDIAEVELDRINYSIKKANIIISNLSMQEIFGVGEGELSEKQIEQQLDLLFYENKEEQKVRLKGLFEDKYIRTRFFIDHKEGRKYYNSNFRLIEVNEKTFIIRIVDDITEEYQQNKIISNQLETLQERQVELEKYIESNLQLENFAYIASHDLKAPLRTVLSFSQLIKRSSYDKLETRDKEFLDIVIKSTNNMMLLIEDLLTFSRVNTKKVQVEQLNINDLKETILLDLTSAIIQNEAELIWNFENQIILADKVKLVQLFENLIRNAIKFTKADEKPLIHIDYSDEGQYHKFSIRDNGIGISQDHFKKIFGIFEKLHSKDVYEGTGLGLSICSKIVEQHHGKIWVDSEMGVGSNFNFTLSKNIMPESDNVDYTSI